MRTHVVVVLICLFPLMAEAQLAEPFQKRSPPNISLNEDTKYQLARKHAGDQALADLGYPPDHGAESRSCPS